MLELGLNRTIYGKAILASCFVNDLGTVIALGLIFAPFTRRTAIFIGVSAIAFLVLPWLTPWFFRKYRDRPSELEAKFLLLTLFALGGLAVWAGSEAVLPAYMVGMVLAGTVGKDHVLVRRLRTLIAAPLVFLAFLAAKMVSKLTGLLPVTGAFRYAGSERIYYSLLMSTGLTFGTISALFGLSHQIIDQTQYSFLVAAVIGSAVVPTMIANAFFMPRHLMNESEPEADNAAA
jgi:glutathione-regulated potassium-efflux system ancillary protein KefC